MDGVNGRVGSGSSGSANTDVEEGEEMEEEEEGEDDAGGAAHSSNRLTSVLILPSVQHVTPCARARGSGMIFQTNFTVHF